MCEGKEDKLVADSSKKKSSSEEIDLSEDFCNMFGTSHNLDEVRVWILCFIVVKLNLVLQ